nr:MAG TPA: hypothetical protein [Caudoviricetes sp.]
MERGKQIEQKKIQSEGRAHAEAQRGMAVQQRGV